MLTDMPDPAAPPQGLSWSWEMDFATVLAALGDGPALTPADATSTSAATSAGAPTAPTTSATSAGASTTSATSAGASTTTSAAASAAPAGVRTTSATSATSAGVPASPGGDGDLEEDEGYLAAVEDRGQVLPAGVGGVRVAERLAPGPDLVAWLALAPAGDASDYDLAGGASSWRRIAAYAQAQELACAAQIASRAARRDPKIGVGPDGRPARIPAAAVAEVSLALTMSHDSAASWTDLAVDLTWRLPATGTALAQGLIDLQRARLITTETSVLPENAARAVEARVLPTAGKQTTAALRHALHRAIIAADPDGAEQRKKTAERRARVRMYPDPDHTATITAQGLPPISAAAAMTRLTAMAWAMKAAGYGGGIDFLRTQVLIGLILGTLPLIPPPADGPPDREPGPGDDDPTAGLNDTPDSPDGGTGDGPPADVSDSPKGGPDDGSSGPDSGADGPADGPGGPSDGLAGPDDPDDGPGSGGGPWDGRGGGPGGPGAGPAERPPSKDQSEASSSGRGSGSGGPWDGFPDPRDEDAPDDSGDALIDIQRILTGTYWPGSDSRSTSRRPGHQLPGKGPPGAGPPDDEWPGPRDDEDWLDTSLAQPWPELPASIPAGPGGPESGSGMSRPPSGLLDVTLPWRTLTGLSPEPGYLGRIGPVTPVDARRLADCAARDPGTTWRIIVTDRAGRALAVARLPRRQQSGAAESPGPGQGRGLVGRITLVICEDVLDGPPIKTPGSSRLPAILRRALRCARKALADARATAQADADAGGCAHKEESAAYRVPPKLRGYITARDVTCRYVTCRRPVWLCDIDHTKPYDQGGRTCKCNGGGLCRTHHQIKQLLGWSLLQPSPGVFEWTTPGNRTYIATPDIYPF